MHWPTLNLKLKEVTKEVEVAGPRAIFFKIGSARLDDYGKVNIELAAKILKANPDKSTKLQVMQTRLPVALLGTRSCPKSVPRLFTTL